MDASVDWDTFSEWESDALQELNDLNNTLKEQPDNKEIRQRIEAIKAFFRPYSSEAAFQ